MYNSIYYLDLRVAIRVQIRRSVHNPIGHLLVAFLATFMGDRESLAEQTIFDGEP